MSDLITEGVDYAWARPGGAKLAANGKWLAVRYLYPGGGKGLTNGEIDDLWAHGIHIAVVYEAGTGNAGEGYAQGASDARYAQAQLNALKLDHNLPIYFAVDFDTSWANVASYFQGVASVLGSSRTGIYAGIRPIQGAQGSGYVSWFWQTYAWSGGSRAANIHLYQYSNGEWSDTVDFTRAYKSEFGQNAGTGEDDVVTSAEMDGIADRVWGKATIDLTAQTGGFQSAGAALAEMFNHARDGIPDNIAAKVWGNPDIDLTAWTGAPQSAEAALREMFGRSRDTAVTLTALQATIGALATASGADPTAIMNSVEQAVEAALAKITVDVSLKGNYISMTPIEPKPEAKPKRASRPSRRTTK